MPIAAGHSPTSRDAGRPIVMPIGTIAFVALDWLVVSMATANSASAKSRAPRKADDPETTEPSPSTMRVWFAATNVLASQAMPNRAMAPTMPAGNVDCFGTSEALTLQNTKISAAMMPMTTSMITVTLRRSGSPSSSVPMTGRRFSNRPKKTITATPARNNEAESTAVGGSLFSCASTVGGLICPSARRF